MFIYIDKIGKMKRDSKKISKKNNNSKKVSRKPSPKKRASAQMTSNQATSSLRDPAIRTFMMPRDTNQLGSIFGGHILSLIDLAAAHRARNVAPLKYVTKVVREVEFIAPVFVGDVVSFYADVVKMGNTSITIKVEVEALRADCQTGAVKVTEAEVVMVAVDDQGLPIGINV